MNTNFLTLALLLFLGVTGCHLDPDGPCCDTAQILTGDSKAAPCHPKAVVTASPIGSSGAALVTCRCSPPEPASCPLPAQVPVHDAAVDE